MQEPIPVIDLFAGPGGLSEGVSALRNASGGNVFRVVLSVEKDADAHRTLLLRAFARQFDDQLPSAYYEYVRRATRSQTDAVETMLWSKHPAEYQRAKDEAWLATLGEISADELTARVRRALGGATDWVLIGGPPCQAYSLAGRSRMRPVRGAAFEDDARHLLYQEYLQILAQHAPPVFVMENVKGLLSATLQGASTFSRIQRDLTAPRLAVGLERAKRGLRYHVMPLVRTGEADWSPSQFIVRSEVHGIPQARHRVLMVGVRSDITSASGWMIQSLAAAEQRLNVEDVIDSLPALRSRLSDRSDGNDAWINLVRGFEPLNWLSPGATSTERALALAQASDLARDLAQQLVVPAAGPGAEFLECDARPSFLQAEIFDPRLGGVLNHSSRSHMSSDIERYFFAACFAATAQRSPNLADFPSSMLPEHRNVQRSLSIAGLFADRFRVQRRGRPSSTITSHLAKDGHYYIHYDPRQVRALTVREAARLQTFPDNYLFEGSRTSQYSQVGNAVPPVLARQVAQVVASAFR